MTDGREIIDMKASGADEAEIVYERSPEKAPPGGFSGALQKTLGFLVGLSVLVLLLVFFVYVVVPLILVILVIFLIRRVINGFKRS